MLRTIQDFRAAALMWEGDDLSVVPGVTSLTAYTAGENRMLFESMITDDEPEVVGDAYLMDPNDADGEEEPYASAFLYCFRTVDGPTVWTVEEVGAVYTRTRVFTSGVDAETEFDAVQERFIQAMAALAAA